MSAKGKEQRNVDRINNKGESVNDRKGAIA